MARIGAALVAFAPPSLVVGFWPEVRDYLTNHPVLSAVALAVYLLALAALGFLSRVGGAVSRTWEPRVADAIDRTVSAVLFRYRTRYLHRLSGDVRDIELLGVATQSKYRMPLQQVYVEVSLMTRSLHETPDEHFVGTPTVSGERRALGWFLTDAEPKVFAVIGGPGSGKTTLLRRTALELCKRGVRTPPLPILLYLRDHVEAIVRNSTATLGSVAASVTWLTGRIPAEWLEGRLDRGRCLVMLDGLDEVAAEDDRKRVVAWVTRQIERYPDNDYVITSRPYGYLANPLSRAEVLQVRRFTGEQISRFINNWYYTIECRSTGESGEGIRLQARAQADDLLTRLRGRSELYDLAANPLLLTMIANVHKYRGALPGSRAGLYGEMCDVLLHRRQDAKGLTNGTGLSGEQKGRVARELALHMMAAQLRDIPAEQARRAIGPTLECVSPEVTPQAFLAEAEQSGLLVEREAEVYAFAHLTFQEYLAAVEIKELRRPELLAQHVDDPWWRETTLLWAAAADASPVIKAGLDSGSVRALALAFDCADEAREFAPDIRKALEQLLASPENSTEQPIEGAAGQDARNDSHEARRRVLTAVKVARSLSEVLWLHEDTAVCVRPVTKDIYTIFAEEEKRRGYPRPLETGTDTSTAVGMWGGDAAYFVDWVNSLFDDGTAYRLPTPDELADQAIGLLSDLTGYSVWTRGDAHPHLHCPDGLPHPYHPTIDQVRQSLATDRNLTSLLLLFTLDLEHALNRDRALDLDLALARARDLALDLALARDLARDRALDAQRAVLLGEPKIPKERILVRSYSVLVALWSPRNKKFKDRQALADFDAFLANVIRGPQRNHILPEQVMESTQSANTLLESSQGARTTKLRELAQRIIADVQDLVTPILTRRAPYDPGAMTCARIGLTAAAAFADQAPGMAEAYSLLCAAVCGLTAVQLRAEGGIVPNEVIVLVRA
ncbi:MAG: NACHT domain-containing protein [Pseudonocardiaceae bacterium]